ncbi:hypothetical protein D3C87_1675210 [compost metagenome]
MVNQQAVFCQTCSVLCLTNSNHILIVHIILPIHIVNQVIIFRCVLHIDIRRVFDLHFCCINTSYIYMNIIFICPEIDAVKIINTNLVKVWLISWYFKREFVVCIYCSTVDCFKCFFKAFAFVFTKVNWIFFFGIWKLNCSSESYGFSFLGKAAAYH